MIYKKGEFVFLLNIFLLHWCPYTVAYTQISTNGGNDEGPKIYKAVNFDLIFPKSENVISTTPETIPSPTKTATSAVGQPYNPLPQSNEPAHTFSSSSSPEAVAIAKQQKPTLFATPPALTTIATPVAVGTSNDEAGFYNTHQNMESYKYTTQVVTQNAKNMQQKQQRQMQQLNDNDKAEMEQQQQYYATGRAVDYHTSYPFGQVITPLIKNAARPVYRKPITAYSAFPTSAPSSSSSVLKVAAIPASSNVAKIIYPQAMYQQKPPSQAEIDKLRGKGSFKDRFAPSEGVASHAFKSNNDHSHDHTHEHYSHADSYKPLVKTPSASNVINSYVTPSNLYAFPPNNVNYPTLVQDTKVALPSGTVDSYSWPASGSLTKYDYNLNTEVSSNPYKYNGPVSPEYLPPANMGSNGGVLDEGKNTDNVDDIDNGTDDDAVGVLPASAMDQGNDANDDDVADGMGVGVMNGDMANAMSTQNDKTPDDQSYDTEKEYPTPPPSWLKEHPESVQDHAHHDNHPKNPDIEFVHDHNYHHQPDIILDHNQDEYHHQSFPPSYSSHPVYHHYPEIIYDDHPHDHPHIEDHPSPTTATEAPLEPSPEPRVKKYSYFYIGRKLWYIPLYFTVWFSFYVLWLILKSIARHKVNLPNHYVARRSINNYNLSQQQQENINQLTVSVLDKIDKFKRKL